MLGELQHAAWAGLNYGLFVVGKSNSCDSAPKFDDPYKERAFWKGRLAAAFRIFAKYGFDEGVAGEGGSIHLGSRRAAHSTLGTWY